MKKSPFFPPDPLLKRLAPQSSVSIARQTAGPRRLIILKNVASTTRTERLLQPSPKSLSRRSPTRSMGMGMTSRWLI